MAMVKLVPNWTKAWKWFSMQFLALAATWEMLPPDVQAIVPEPYRGYVTLALLIGAGFGRMVRQPAANP